MGWKGFTRQVLAASRRAQRQADASRRRSERKEHRRQRELARAEKEWDRLETLERARAEYESFVNSVEVLRSMHKECSDPVEWVVRARSVAPVAPTFSNANQTAAEATLAAYRPGFFARVFSLEAKQKARLTTAISEARELDHSTHARLEREHKVAFEEWSWHHQLAAGVVAGDLAAYEAAVSYFEPLEELQEHGCQIQIVTSDSWYVTVDLLARDESIVPGQEKSLLASGKLSVKKMPAAKQRELYQDYVCGCAIRCGRELLSLLPVDFVLVHVSIDLLDKSTGHHGPTPVLSAAFSRSGIQRLKMDALDPSDAMTNFLHRMGFKKSSGFSRVEPIQASELSRATPGASTNVTGSLLRL